MEWVGEPEREIGLKSFYKSCLLRRDLTISVEDFVLIDLSGKHEPGIACVLNIFEDRCLGGFPTSDRRRADILWIYKWEELPRKIKTLLRKRGGAMELYIPCNSPESVVVGSMETIMLRNISEKVAVSLESKFKEIKHYYATHGFNERELFTARRSLSSSQCFCFKYSGYEQSSLETCGSRTLRARSQNVLAISERSKLYNISIYLDKVNLKQSRETEIEFPCSTSTLKPSLRKLNTASSTQGSDSVSRRSDGRKRKRAGQGAEMLEFSQIQKLYPKCREREAEMIHSFLSRHLGTESAACLYISGVPGTGKTHTTRAISEAICGIREVKLIYLNGMSLANPNHTLNLLCKRLLGRKTTIEKSVLLLDEYFQANESSESIVIIVDELDRICNKNQTIIYNIFNWTWVQHSKLIVIAIANTLDLPERVLHKKITSRIGFTRLTFQPYTYQEMTDIIHSGFMNVSGFEKDALSLATRKVAAFSGDLRRCVDICERSLDMTNKEAVVSIKSVNTAIMQTFKSPKSRALENLSEHEKMILRVVATMQKNSGIVRWSSSTLMNHMAFGESVNEDFKTQGYPLRKVLFRLLIVGILACESSNYYGKNTVFQLRLRPEEVLSELGSKNL